MSDHLKIHVVQHIDFEGPAYIQEWACQNKYTLSYTKLHKNQKLPKPDDFDLLVIMGGPMSVNDADKYDWLSYEVDFIKTSIEAGKAILGICLGAQLIAKAMEANVYPVEYPEIGWFPILLERKDLPKDLKNTLPDYLTTFHWHGETFDIPRLATGFASSTDTPNQAFIYNRKVIGLQFHPEVNSESIDTMLHHMGHEIHESRYIQPIEAIQYGKINCEKNHAVMKAFLSYLSKHVN